MKDKTSWSPVAKWYSNIVGTSGHYYHSHVILPKLKKLVNPFIGQSVLDIGCGQGVYARTIGKGISYTGVDISSELIEEAKKLDRDTTHKYVVADACKYIPLEGKVYDHIVAILSLQNMKDAAQAIINIGKLLKKGGDFTLVLNHPAFRIPRQSSWEIDEKQKLEYRRINRYLTPLEVPINAHPGEVGSPVTWSYHYPLEYFFKNLKQAGMVVTDLEEWVSDKESVGKMGKAENRARSEFPLFLALRATSA